MSKVAVIGGGAAGMFASIAAAENGNQVEVFEKNEKLGKKLFITGKGRCNLTNACDMEELFDSVCTNPKFLYSAFYGCTNQDVMDFFEREGLSIKTERGGRVFPVSDHSSDVINCLSRTMKGLGVKVHYNSTVKEVLRDDQGVTGLVLEDNTKVEADAVIVATGGFSYQSTGSTGDGYRFARELGIKVTELLPSLVPMNIREESAPRLQGLSLRNVRASIYDGKKLLYSDLGEMMFTHFGVTGPLILTASSQVGRQLKKKGELTLSIDLKPALSHEQLDKRVLRDFEEGINKQFKNVITGLFPAKLTPVILELSRIPQEKKVNEISKGERTYFVNLIKDFRLTITGLRDYNEAIITKGGVSVKEVNPSTMESKQVPGLYFVGEVLDLDGVTGGFNLQIAWSTAYAAGKNII